MLVVALRSQRHPHVGRWRRVILSCYECLRLCKVLIRWWRWAFLAATQDVQFCYFLLNFIMRLCSACFFFWCFFLFVGSCQKIDYESPLNCSHFLCGSEMVFGMAWPHFIFNYTILTSAQKHKPCSLWVSQGYKIFFWSFRVQCTESYDQGTRSAVYNYG